MIPLISVVMATYNGEKYIEEAIQSVLDQTYRNFEFIIVDDGSTDNTATLIKSYPDDRIIYIKKEVNSGISDSLNLGISRAKGKYIARMDDDDVSLPNRFKLQLEVLEKNKNIIFCGSNVLNNDGKPLSTPTTHDDILMTFLFRNPIFHPTALIRREVLLENHYRSNMVPSEDYDLWSRLIFKGQFFQFEEPLLYCRIHQTSITARRRHEQLKLNASITSSLYTNLGLINLPNHGENLKFFSTHDYSISGSELKSLMAWFEALKSENEKLKLFDTKKFNKEANRNRDKFLISYFVNQKLTMKCSPFLKIKFQDKLKVLNYYLYKVKDNFIM